MYVLWTVPTWSGEVIITAASQTYCVGCLKGLQRSWEVKASFHLLKNWRRFYSTKSCLVSSHCVFARLRCLTFICNYCFITIKGLAQLDLFLNRAKYCLLNLFDDPKHVSVKTLPKKWIPNIFSQHCTLTLDVHSPTNLYKQKAKSKIFLFMLCFFYCSKVNSLTGYSYTVFTIFTCQ